MALWGGTGLNADRESLTNYVASAKRFSDIARQAGADIILSNHTDWDRGKINLPILAKRAPGSPNPYVTSNRKRPTVYEGRRRMRDGAFDAAELKRFRQASIAALSGDGLSVNLKLGNVCPAALAVSACGHQIDKAHFIDLGQVGVGYNPDLTGGDAAFRIKGVPLDSLERELAFLPVDVRAIGKISNQQGAACETERRDESDAGRTSSCSNGCGRDRSDTTTKRVLSFSVRPHGVVHMPVHGCRGFVSLPVVPAIRISLPVGPRSLISRLGLAT